MTAEAKAIHETILENGPLDTVRLRREARLSAESAQSRFDGALVELQVGLKVLPIGVAHTGAWNPPTNCSSAGSPRFPNRPVPSKRSEARRVLVLRYLDNVVAADRKMIAKVFHVSKWTSSARIIPRQDRADTWSASLDEHAPHPGIPPSSVPCQIICSML
jgi:hypothetical protein